MKRAKLSPTPSLTLTLAIASVLGAAQTSLAAPVVRAEAAEGSPEISQIRAVPSLSQVRGDIAELWVHQGQFTSANANPLKDLPRCACPACSGILPERTEI